MLRRSGNTINTNDRLKYNGITLDNAGRTVTADGEQISLTYKEYELLNYLLINKGIVLSRDKIMERFGDFFAKYKAGQWICI